MKIYLAIIGLLFTVSTLSAQSKKDCKQILEKEISFENLQENGEEIGKNVQILLGCDFDDLDVEIFSDASGDDNLSLLTQAILFLGVDATTENAVTYGDLKDLLLQQKNSDYYIAYKKKLKAEIELSYKNADLENWPIDKGLLADMGFDEMQIDSIKKVIDVNQQKPYTEIFAIYVDALSLESKR
ncbi:hypothetical protein [Chondrinema litorale]|uniref:hypothetical protein n=1 Tax=Chondrinema litorale TaxID=2994555 RepID=UPI00254305F0|nr:hypothetical protein [Chondrinema litorale]UZR97158.1 hypothetical protein OQ292_24990 [Chondrinema litorale]